MTKELYASLCEIVNYLHADERKHWEEAEKPAVHIYHDVHRVAKWLDTITPPQVNPNVCGFCEQPKTNCKCD